MDEHRQEMRKKLDMAQVAFTEGKGSEIGKIFSQMVNDSAERDRIEKTLNELPSYQTTGEPFSASHDNAVASNKDRDQKIVALMEEKPELCAAIVGLYEQAAEKRQENEKKREEIGKNVIDALNKRFMPTGLAEAVKELRSGDIDMAMTYISHGMRNGVNGIGKALDGDEMDANVRAHDSLESVKTLYEVGKTIEKEMEAVGLPIERKLGSLKEEFKKALNANKEKHPEFNDKAVEWYMMQEGVLGQENEQDKRPNISEPPFNLGRGGNEERGGNGENVPKNKENVQKPHGGGRGD